MIPQKVYLEKSELERGHRCLDLGESMSTHFLLYPHKDDMEDLVPYVPESRIAALEKAIAEVLEDEKRLQREGSYASLEPLRKVMAEGRG